MAGRRERQKQARERRILKAAEALFVRRGYAETGMGQIARRARLAVGTLYNYFPSKPDLLAALLRQDTGELLAEGEALLKRPPGDATKALVALFEVYADLARRHDKKLWRELLAAALTQPGGLARTTLEQDLRLVAQTARLLEELQARGAIRADLEPGSGALALYAVYVTWLQLWIAADELSFDTFREQLGSGIRVVVQGLAPPRRAPAQGGREGAHP